MRGALMLLAELLHGTVFPERTEGLTGRTKDYVGRYCIFNNNYPDP